MMNRFQTIGEMGDNCTNTWAIAVNFCTYTDTIEDI